MHTEKGEAMDKLKPCPFCGDDEFEIVAEFVSRLQNTYHTVCCVGCGARSAGHLHREIAIKRWNRRYTPTGEIDFDYEAEDGQ